MTPDLFYLALTAFLTATLWLPYIASQIITNGPMKPENYTDPTARPIHLWGQRANRAYMNALEAFAPFAALVLIAHLTGKVDATVMFWIIFFFWVRVGHAVVYLLGWPYIRTVFFSLGFIAVASIFVHLVF
jgi:uncharacterized MAPEG superfamily protein